MQNNRANKSAKGEIKTSVNPHTKSKAGSLRRTMHAALEQLERDQSISFSPIDSWVYMLAIPSSFKYTVDETKQIAKEIQHTILPPKKPRTLFQIVTWPDIGNTHYKVTPNHKEWYSGKGRPLDDGTQYVFFFDTELLKDSVLNALGSSAYQTSNQHDLSQFCVSDGRFDRPVPLIELASKSIWTARNLIEVIDEWVSSLAEIFQTTQNLYLSLKTNYPKARFSMDDKKILSESTLGNHSLDYNHMVDAILYSNAQPNEWLKSISINDLISFESRTTITMRSKIFAKARPELLHSKETGYILAAQKDVGGRLTPVLLEETQNSARLKHFISDDKRHLPKKTFTGHIFCQEFGDSFSIGLVGDQVASIALHPELVLGALLTMMKRTNSVRVIAVSEDILVISHGNTPWIKIEESIRRANSLLLSLLPDGSDPVQFDEHIQLPELACGQFDFLPVPNSFFDLIETAADESLVLPPGRMYYLRGLAFELIREWSLAEQEFRRAFSANSADGDVCHALGRSLGETGKHKEALQFLKKAAFALPEDGEIANTYGLALLKCSHAEQAAKLFERAVQLVPDDPQFLSNLGQSYFMTQRLQDAERILGKALEYAPSFSDAHSILAQIRWRQGDISAARKHARKAFAANPGNKGVQDLLWALTVDENK